jgi:A distinct subfamily of CDD/CDA-like deaminases
VKIDQTDTRVRLAVAEIIRFKEEFEFIRNDSTIETDLSSFWLRKTKKPVLAVLVVQKPGQGPKLYRGTNMEVSMPTGSLCAERNVIGSALADDLTLRRQDLKVIAVYSVGSLEETKQSRDRLMEEDGMGSGMGTRRGSSGSEGFISHASSSIDLFGADTVSNPNSANQKQSRLSSGGTDRLPSPYIHLKHVSTESLGDSPVTQTTGSLITKSLSDGHLSREIDGNSNVASQIVQPASKRQRKNSVDGVSVGIHINKTSSASTSASTSASASASSLQGGMSSSWEGNSHSFSSNPHYSDPSTGTTQRSTDREALSTQEDMPPLQEPSDKTLPADVRRWVTAGKRSYSVDSGTFERGDVDIEATHTEAGSEDRGPLILQEVPKGLHRPNSIPQIAGMRALEGGSSIEEDRLIRTVSMLARSPSGKKRDIMSIPIVRPQGDQKTEGPGPRTESKSGSNKVKDEVQIASDVEKGLSATLTSTPGASRKYSSIYGCLISVASLHSRYTVRGSMITRATICPVLPCPVLSCYPDLIYLVSPYFFSSFHHSAEEEHKRGLHVIEEALPPPAYAANPSCFGRCECVSSFPGAMGEWH